MKISELLEDVTPFPTSKVQPTKSPPKYGAAVIPMAPFQQERQVNQQRLQMERSLDSFTNAYIAAALWSTTDDHGDPMDDNYTMDDIADPTFLEMIRDCKDFQEANAQLIAHTDDEQAGHDFWLTRNHHGAGFRDRGLGEVGDQLTNAAHAYGDFDLTVGDDGKIYG